MFNIITILQSQKMIKEVIPYFYAISANTCMDVMNLFMKMLVIVITSSQAIYIRSLLCLFLNSYFVFFNKEKYNYEITQNNPIKKINSIEQTNQLNETNQLQTKSFSLHIQNRKDFIMMLKHIIMNCFTAYFLTVSYKLLPLGVATAFYNTAPIIAFFIEGVIFKKPILKIHLWLAFLCFIGAVLVLDPLKNDKSDQNLNNSPNSKVHLYYIAFPILAAVTSCVSNIYLHELRNKIDQIISLEYRYIFNTIYFSIANFALTNNSLESNNQDQAYFTSSIFDPYFVGTIVLVVILNSLANYLKVKAIYLLPPSKILCFNYFGIILSIFFDITIFGYQIAFIQIIGIFLVNVGLLSKILIALWQSKNNQPKQASEKV